MKNLGNNEPETEKIDRPTMYKMIDSLLKYDYYSAKCLVGVFLEQRRDEKELEVLNRIKELLAEEKIEEARKVIEKEISK